MWKMVKVKKLKKGYWTVKNSIAVIGNIDSVLVFKTVGFDVFGVNTEVKARNTLNKLLTQYKVIFITEEFAKCVEDIIEDTYTKAYPIVTVIPSGINSSQYALDKIKQGVEKALGVNILFDKEKN